MHHDGSSALRGQARSGGFTLVELLTVIVIIGILASIIIPVVGKARESARSAVCLGNLRQLGMAATMFSQNNRGLMPNQGIWPRQLLPYADATGPYHDVYWCPSASVEANPPNASDGNRYPFGDQELIPLGYGINVTWPANGSGDVTQGSFDPDKTTRYRSMMEPAGDILLFMDQVGGRANVFNSGERVSLRHSDAGVQGIVAPAINQRMRFNACMVDGSARRIDVPYSPAFGSEWRMLFDPRIL